MFAIFLSTFLNTGLLVIIVNANLKYAPWPLNLIPLTGSFVDYN